MKGIKEIKKWCRMNTFSFAFKWSSPVVVHGRMVTSDGLERTLKEDVPFLT
jgi:hypothetical protein